jgi:hypothetical protein
LDIGPSGAVEFSDADTIDDQSKEGSQCSEDGRGKLNDEEDIESIDHEGQQHEAAAFESIFDNHNRNNEYHENLEKRESESPRENTFAGHSVLALERKCQFS